MEELLAPIADLNFSLSKIINYIADEVFIETLGNALLYKVTFSLVASIFDVSLSYGRL